MRNTMHSGMINRAELVAAVLIVVLAAGPRSVAGESNDAFGAALRSTKLGPEGGAGEYQGMVQAADVLAQTLGKRDIDMLKAKALLFEQPGVMQLAVTTLARMKESEAATALEELVAEAKNVYVRIAAVKAVGVMPGEKSRETVHRLLSRKIEIDAMEPCLRLLAAVGDTHSLSVIERARGNGSNEFVAAAAEGSKRSLGVSLAEADADARQAWQRQERVYWEAGVDMPNFARLTGSFEMAGKQAVARGGRFTVPFLRAKLELGEPLAVVLSGLQKEKDIIENLRPYVDKAEAVGVLARRALMQIGTPEACRILEFGLRSSELHVARETAALLSYCGDTATLKVLKELSVNGKGELKAACRDGVERLEKRLEP